jgi:hypothetical protein
MPDLSFQETELSKKGIKNWGCPFLDSPALLDLTSFARTPFRTEYSFVIKSALP